MSNLTGPILTYIALIGLILTTGIATFETIQSSLSRQFIETTKGISGSRVSADRTVPAGEDLYSYLYSEENPGVDLAEYSEDGAAGNPEEAGKQGILVKHFSRLERIGDRIAAKLSGGSP